MLNNFTLNTIELNALPSVAQAFDSDCTVSWGLIHCLSTAVWSADAYEAASWALVTCLGSTSWNAIECGEVDGLIGLTLLFTVEGEESTSWASTNNSEDITWG